MDDRTWIDPTINQQLDGIVQRLKEIKAREGEGAIITESARTMALYTYLLCERVGLSATDIDAFLTVSAQAGVELDEMIYGGQHRGYFAEIKDLPDFLGIGGELDGR